MEQTRHFVSDETLKTVMKSDLARLFPERARALLKPGEVQPNGRNDAEESQR